MRRVVNSTPRTLYRPGKRPGTHCTEGWVDLGAGLDGCGKSRTTPGFDPLTVHAVASRYTDYDIPAPRTRQYSFQIIAY
jgi:hypothetical protein